MQTFKTAVVVVLLLTVMYGAYVSLTTPPPDDIGGLEGLITELDIEEGNLGIDDGSGTSFGISDEEITEGSSEVPPSLGSIGSSTEGGVTSRLSDSEDQVATNSPPHRSKPVEAAIADHPADSPTPPRSLPKPNAEESEVEPDPQQRYASTDQSLFNLPDPASLPFDPSSESADEPWVAEDESATAAEQPAEAGLSMSAESAADDSTAMDGSSDATENSAKARPKNSGFANAIATADRLVKNDQIKEALATLSVFYSSPDLTNEEREQLLQRLDPLAGEVIYSRRHLLEQPHRVGQNETLMEIAAKYDTPWQLLANINGIEDPVIVLPGTELKVVRGPFRAEVDLARAELTIFLGESYAGRFPIVLGSDPSPEPGTYTVQDKQTAKTYYDATGTPIPPGDARNPFGDVWLDLGKQMCIHGSSGDANTAGKGCISLEPAHAQDVYAILTQGASVTVHR